MPGRVVRLPSIGSAIWREISSGPAPGYVVDTATTGILISGNRSMPRPSALTTPNSTSAPKMLMVST